MSFFVAAYSSHECIPRKEEDFAFDSDWWASAWVAFNDWPSVGTGTGFCFAVKDVTVFAHGNTFTRRVSRMIDLVNFILLAGEGTLRDMRTISAHTVIMISSVGLIHSAANDLVSDEKGVFPGVTCGTIASCSREISIFTDAHVLLEVVNESVSAADEVVFLIVERVLALKTISWEAAEFINSDRRVTDRWVAADRFHAVPAHAKPSGKVILVRLLALVCRIDALSIVIGLGHVRTKALSHLAFVPGILRAADKLWESKRRVESIRTLSAESHVVNWCFIRAKAESRSNVVLCSLETADDFWLEKSWVFSGWANFWLTTSRILSGNGECLIRAEAFPHLGNPSAPVWTALKRHDASDLVKALWTFFNWISWVTWVGADFFFRIPVSSVLAALEWVSIEDRVSSRWALIGFR